MHTRPSRPVALPLPALLTALVALFLLGASCDSGARGHSTAEEPKAAPLAGERIQSLPGVDVGPLTAGERERWVELVNSELSPCGDPVSVARCVDEKRACAECVPAARYLVRLLADGFESSEIRTFYQARYDADAELDIPLNGAPERGAPMAPVTIVEFSDFECPYCGAAHPLLKRVLATHEGKVKLVFKHFPLSGHDNALPAALAAVAAQQQGDFWTLADLLFEHQHELSRERILELAREANLDMAKFNDAWQSDAVAKRVEADKADGRALEVSGTPTLFVNGRRFVEPLQNLPKYVAEELER